jgi:hypothetical protein
MITFVPVVTSPIVPDPAPDVHIEANVYVPEERNDVLLPLTQAPVKGPAGLDDQRAEFQAPVSEVVV